MPTPPLYDSYWNYAKPDETAVRFRELLPAVKASGDRSAHLQLLTQLARTHSLQQQFDEAHRLLDEVEMQLASDLPEVTIRYLLERGRTFSSAGEKEQARVLFSKAYRLAKENEAEYYAVDAAHMMGIAAETVDEQLAWNETAVAAAEGSDRPYVKRWLGSLYNNIGWSYHARGEFDKALGWFERAEHFFRSDFPNKGRARIARWAIARTLRSLGEVDEALAMQTALLKENRARSEEDGYVYEELGECLLLLGEENEARPYFAKAYRLLSQDSWLSANEPDRLARLKALSARS